jgi:voltage-gated potassium channel
MTQQRQSEQRQSKQRQSKQRQSKQRQSKQRQSRQPMTQQRWRELTEWPLAFVSVIFIVAYAWEVIGDIRPPSDVDLQFVMWSVWALFVIDYAVNLALARPRWRWFYRHLLELAIVALPFLRPLRLLRLLALFAVLQRAAGSALRGRVAIYVASSALLLVFVAALAVLDAEQNVPGARIKNFADAMWWAFVTITTVGYGDYTPITETGRLVAVGLMICGIALLGVVTATLASWFVERVQSSQKTEERLTRDHINELVDEVAGLRADLAMLAERLAGSESTSR